ncbi:MULTISPECIES: DUF4381 domain-containing protein [Vibrio]|uniref:DUF4381 domain-containing protein n=1 Tax=Vibrio halioticoli NBRC 102217 TaxID=1219072 RepID=V5HL19_9VIBR|nr:MULTISPECIES: DUF4381 domain-containing protein [Vibrio]MPW35989.1 DUF4381 family protein [Vibrio sp. B1Z05]GAD89870.1 hypothetical protein VHA01S_029_00030 [Vibrio halioticoli NBRC 102217]
MTQTNQAHTLPLKSLHLPPEPSAWPLAWGYWGGLALIVIVLLAAFITHKKIRNRNRAKKAALHILNQPAHQLTISEAQELLRQAALSYFPREDIANLTGDEWLSFLDSQLSTPRFMAKNEQWQIGLYSSGVNEHHTNLALIEDCAYWLEHALPPKRKYRNWNES